MHRNEGWIKALGQDLGTCKCKPTFFQVEGLNPFKVAVDNVTPLLGARQGIACCGVWLARIASAMIDLDNSCFLTNAVSDNSLALGGFISLDWPTAKGKTKHCKRVFL